MKSYIFIIFIFHLILNVKGINILSKNVINKNINIMGVDISYGLYDIEFDEDIYKHYGFGCPVYSENMGDIKYNVSNVGECFCDYTTSNTPIYPSTCGTVFKCSIDQITQSYSNDWETIIIDGTENQFTISGNTQFRYHDKKVAQGHSVIIKPINGSFTATLYESVYQVPQRFESLNDEIIFNMCPTLVPVQRINYGNYFLNIEPNTPDATFSIQLTYLDLPVKIDGVTYTTATCSNDIDTHTCIGIGTLIQPMEPTLYQIDIIEPGYYLIDLKSMGDAILYISDNSSIITPNDDSSKWIIQNYGNSNFYNSLNIYLNQSTTLYLNLVCPSGICSGVNGNTPDFYIIQPQSIIESKISSMGLLEGSLALASSSRIKVSDRYYSCSEFSSCNPYSILLPTRDINPLVPVPAALQFIQDFDYRTIQYNNNNDNIQIKQNSYQFAFILSIDYGKGIIEYLNKNQISNIELEFINTIFDSTGNVINLKISNFNQLNLSTECNSELFNNLVNNINIGMDNKDLSIIKLNNWKYNVGLVQSSNEWIQCENYVLSYLELASVTYNISSSQCSYQKSDSRYNQDPCCNYHLLFSNACLKKQVQVETYKVKDFNNDKINQDCFSSDCTSIILSNYATQKYLLRENDGCKVSHYDIINTHLDTYSALRECRESVLLNIPSCSTDLDCQEFSQGTRKCDLFKRKCIVNYEITDKSYIECVLESLPSGTRYSLTSTLDINSTIVNGIYDRFKINDIVIESGEPKHSTYQYYLDFSEYSSTRNIIDYSNEINYKSENQIKGWIFEKEDYFKDKVTDQLLNQEELNCLAYYKMLPSGYDQQVYSSYYYQCSANSDALTQPSVHSFCGYCSDIDTYCYIYNGSLSHTGSPYLVYGDDYPFSSADVTIDETTCNEELSMCLLKDGSYIPNIDKNDCEDNKGSCSAPCGYECTGVENKCIWLPIEYRDNGEGNVYFNLDIMCADEGFTYEEDGLCNTGYNNEQECLQAGYIWLDCPSQDIDNCIGPNFNITDPDSIDINNYYRSLCKLKEIPCASQEECIKQGHCSDYEIFYNNQQFDDIYPYPNGLGKCLFNHSIESIYGMTCDPFSQYDSVSGCYSVYSIPGREVCEIKNGKWWKASTNQIECESQMGCKSLDYMYQNNQENINPFNLPFATRFNEMDKDNCLLQQDQSGTKWVNKFKWSNAVWYPGVHVTSKWYQNKTFTNMYQEKEALDYQQFYNNVIDATQDQVSILYSSESYCQKEKNENYIQSVICSCSIDGSGNSTCFNSTNRIQSQAIVCNDQSKQLLFTNGNISFSDSSAPYGCEMVEILEITKSVYSISSPQPLSNNFISYLKPPKYSVLNSKKAIIGTLLDDGIILKSEYGLNQIRLCHTFNGSNPDEESYPILDFAIKLQDKLEPYGSVAIKEEYNGIVYYCSTIYNLTNNEVIYPMNRVSDWEDQNRKVLDNRSTVLVYILATLFLVTGLYGLLQTVEFIIQKFQTKTPFQLTHLLIVSVSTFVLIRSFYFYVLPRGKLSDYHGSDYVLVVLPTFIYLSSFSILIVLWSLIVFMVLKFNPAAGNIKKRLYSIVGAINTLIYMFFVAIVVIFQFSPFKPNKDCVNLIFNELKNSNTQEAISIAYSVVQAFISLFIGIGFIYLGNRIISEMKRVNLGGIYSNNQPKIKALAIICGTAFILHTIFIILISIRSVKYIIFTFIGLVLSEIMPALAILYAFDNRFIKSSQSRPHSQSTSTKSVHLNTVTTETGTESSELQINSRN